MKFPWLHTSIVDVLKNDEKVGEKCKHIIQDLESHKIEISEFVEELGPALTHTDTDIRLKGMKLLSDTLNGIPADLLNETQLNFLCTFYCDRMKDHHSIAPQVLRGILAISKMTHVPEGSSTKVFTTIFQNIACQSQLKDDRYNLFNIFRNFSITKTTELTALGSDFIYGVINAIDGERDPRNLVFLFDEMPSFIKKFPLHHLSEEMFEIFGCYFPIDFHPAPNDPNAITRDLLAEKLSNCLTAAPAFAENCITLLLEKLESDLNVAKFDSLRLLIKCTQEFEMKEIEPHFEDIWKALKLELLPGSGNKEVTALALKSIKCLLISSTENAKSTEFMLTTIFITIMGSLADVESRLFPQGTQIALVCASATSYTSVFVSSKILPLCLSQLQAIEHLTNTQKGTLLELLQHTLIICKDKDVIVDMDKSILDAVQKEFVQVVMQEADGNLQAVGLQSLTKISEIVTSDNRYAVYTTLVNILLSNDEKSKLNVNDCLYEFGIKHPVEVMCLIVNKLLERTYDNSPSTIKVFSALAKLVSSEVFKEKILSFLLKIVFENDATNLKLQITAMKTIQTLIEVENSKELTTELYEKYKIMEKFFQYVQENPNLSSDFLYEMSIILKLIIKRLDTDQQTAVIKTYLKGRDLSKIDDLYLTSGILGFLDEAVILEDHFENLVNDLTKLALETKDEDVRGLCHHLLCSLFNKMPDDLAHRGILKKLLVFLKDEVKKHNKQAVGVLSWIAKGLLARGHAEAAELIEDISELLEHPTLCHAASVAFEILSIEFPHLHLPLIKHLFKQKLFILVLKKLENKLEKYSESHLKALAFVFNVAPHLVLKMNILKVGPILFKCLNVDDEKTLITALKIVNNFLKQIDEYFRDHVQHLVPQLLKLTTFKSSMKVRVESLDCLLNMTGYPTFLLVPYKQDVVLGLQPALDDHKRLVRNAAVATRLKWFVIGSPDDEASKK